MKKVFTSTFKAALVLAFAALPCLAAPSNDTTTSVTIAAGTNALTVPSALAFTGAVTGLEHDVTGAWTGVFTVSDLSGAASPWVINVKATEFTGTTAPTGTVAPTIAGLNLSAVSFTSSSTGHVAGDYNFASITTGVLTTDQAYFDSKTATIAGVSVLTPNNALTTLHIPANAAAGSWTSAMTFTATGL